MLWGVQGLNGMLRNFVFLLRFDKRYIVSVPRNEQVDRAISFLGKLGSLSPLMRNWYLQSRSIKDALSKNVILAPDFLKRRWRITMILDFLICWSSLFGMVKRIC